MTRTHRPGEGELQLPKVPGIPTLRVRLGIGLRKGLRMLITFAHDGWIQCIVGGFIVLAIIAAWHWAHHDSPRAVSTQPTTTTTTPSPSLVAAATAKESSARP